MFFSFYLQRSSPGTGGTEYVDMNIINAQKSCLKTFQRCRQFARENNTRITKRVMNKRYITVRRNI